MLTRKGLLSSLRHLEIYHRLLSIKAAKELKLPKRKSTAITEKEVYKYYNYADRKVAHSFPETFFVKKRGKTPDNFYVASNLAASTIANSIKKDLPADKLIMEINPGIGLLTEKLITETDNDLFLYEAHEQLFDKLAVSFIYIKYLDHEYKTFI